MARGKTHYSPRKRMVRDIRWRWRPSRLSSQVPLPMRIFGEIRVLGLPLLMEAARISPEQRVGSSSGTPTRHCRVSFLRTSGCTAATHRFRNGCSRRKPKRLLRRFLQSFVGTNPVETTVRNRGIGTGEGWFTCAMCGQDYPMRYLAWQNGKARCTYKPCLDEGSEDRVVMRGRPPRIEEIYPPEGD